MYGHRWCLTLHPTSIVSMNTGIPQYLLGFVKTLKHTSFQHPKPLTNAFPRYGDLFSGSLFSLGTKIPSPPRVVSFLYNPAILSGSHTPLKILHAFYSELQVGRTYSSLSPTPCHSCFWEHKKCSINIC